MGLLALLVCRARLGSLELLVVEQVREQGDEGNSKVAREQEQSEVSVGVEDEEEEQMLLAAAAVLNARSARPSRPVTSMQNSRHS